MKRFGWFLMVVGMSSGLARAEEPAVESRGANELRFDLGMFAPTGFLGATYGRDLGEHVSLEAGVGLTSLGSGLTAALSLMPKAYVAASPSSRFYFGVGMSVDKDLTGSASAIWLNWDAIGLEYRGDSHLLVNAAFGLFKGVAGEVSAPSGNPWLFFQTHVGIGYWF